MPSDWITVRIVCDVCGSHRRIGAYGPQPRSKHINANCSKCGKTTRHRIAPDRSVPGQVS